MKGSLNGYSAKSSATRKAKALHGANWAKTHTVSKIEDLWHIAEIEAKPVVKKEPVVVMPKAKVAKPKPPTGTKSSVDSPCRTVWCIAGDMGADAKRKDVIEECVRQGVNFYTARTQYQRYKEALKAASQELVVNTKKALEVA